MRRADFVVDLAAGQQSIMILVEFPAIPTVDAVYHQMVRKAVGIDVGCDHYFIAGKGFLGQFQTNGVDRLGA